MVDSCWKKEGRQDKTEQMRQILNQQLIKQIKLDINKPLSEA